MRNGGRFITPGVTKRARNVHHSVLSAAQVSMRRLLERGRFAADFSATLLSMSRSYNLRLPWMEGVVAGGAKLIVEERGLLAAPLVTLGVIGTLLDIV